MKHKILRMLPAFLIIAILMFSPLVKSQDADIKREEILWSSGYWGPPGINNPAHELSASWESKFMYEVLFDWNSVLEDPLVGFLGETMEWSTNGSYITITMKEVAKWSDGEIIDADDVIYTFNEVYAIEGGPLHTLIEEKVSSIVKSSQFVVNVTVNPGYEFSRSVFNMFVGRWQILPAHVWPQIAQYEWQNGGNSKIQMAVDWFSSTFPEELKVCSGMYQPHSIALDNSWSLYERRDDWWGVGVLTDKLPAPKYIGMRSYDENFIQNSEFTSGKLDWFGGFIKDIDKEIESNPELSTYYGDNEPYFASLSTIVEVVPNHHIYPLSEHWLREAIAYSLNIQDMIDIGASGYLEPARVGRIDDRSPLLEHLYDPSVEETYGFNYNLSHAQSILQEHAIKVDGSWYTKDTPVEWRVEFPDDLPSQSGHNVKIGPYTMKTPSGWSDFEDHMATFQLQMQDIDIGIATQKVEYATFVAASQAMNFDLLLYGLGPGLLDKAITNFNYFTGPEGKAVNTTGWYSPEYKTLVDQFELTSQGSQEEYNVASQLQELLAKDLPSIPLFGNGYWYSFNTKYWENWPTQENNVMPPMAMWAFGTTGLMNQLVWSLESSGETSTDGGLGYWIYAIPVVILVPVIWRWYSRR